MRVRGKNKKKISPIFMDVNELSDLLGVTARTIWRMDARGDIPLSVKFGNQVRWKRLEIETWIANDCPPPEGVRDAF